MPKTKKGRQLDEILVHPSQRYLDLLNAHSLSRWIFSKNATELRQLTASLENSKNAENLFERNTQKDLQTLHDEVSRRFHNFIASAKTLVDHTRTLMNGPAISTAHKAEHETEITRQFAGDPPICFTHDLRNYMLHRSIPWTGMQVSKVVGSPAKSSVHIDLGVMELWEGWTAPSRTFTGQHKPKLRIQELVDRYETKTRAFYERFSPRFEEHYRGDIDAVRTLWRQWNTP